MNNKKVENADGVSLENVHVEALPNMIYKENVNDPITWSLATPIEERAEALIEKMDRIIEKLDEVIKAMEVHE